MGKKGGKKKSGKGKKGKQDDQMSVKEAILAYQIGIKEKEMEDVMFEMKELQKKNNRYKSRNSALKGEQLNHMKEMLKQWKEEDNTSQPATVVSHEQVESTLHDKWMVERTEKQLIENIKTETESVEEFIINEQKVVDIWNLYKDIGQHDHAKEVKLLQQELDDMQASFDEMAEFLQVTLDQSREEITVFTEKCLHEQKELASENALKMLNKNDSRECRDNDWLRKEVVVYRQEVCEIQTEVETLEKHNLQIMCELFECRIEDLKISRNFFLTQMDYYPHDDTDIGVLESDLQQLAIDQPLSMGDSESGNIDSTLNINHTTTTTTTTSTVTDRTVGAVGVVGGLEKGGPLSDTTSGYHTITTSSEISHEPSVVTTDRPKSAKLRAIEEKISSLNRRTADDSDDSGAETNDDDDDIFLNNTGVITTQQQQQQQQENTADLFDNYINLENDAFDDILKLGPLELRLLNIEGHKAVIHRVPDLTPAEATAKLTNPDVWPVTKNMLTSFTKSPHVT